MPYDAQALRVLNAVLFCVVVPYQIRRLLQLRWYQSPPNVDTQLGERTEIGDQVSQLAWREINHTVLNICLFPPLFFFSVLYYTDVLSASCVLATHILFLQRRQTKYVPAEEEAFVDAGNGAVSWLRACYRAGSPAQKPWVTDIGLCALGLYALLFRQTNIFWVAIFFAGLEVIQIVKRNSTTSWEGDDSSFAGVFRGSWYHGMIYDPLVREACTEGKLSPQLHRSCLTRVVTADYLKTVISLAIGTAANLNAVLASLTPYIFLLTALGGFILWNGGVVLGKRETHLPVSCSLTPPQDTKSSTQHRSTFRKCSTSGRTSCSFPFL